MSTNSQVGLAQNERLDAIESRLRVDRSVRIDELATALAVSEMTVRRDLDELEALGIARRVRGGAVIVGPETFTARHRYGARAKSRIAEKLLELVPHTGAIALDASSTVHRLASKLEGARDLVVVTNGLDTFQVLRDRPGIEVTLTGGTVEPRTGSLVGPVAARGAEDFLSEAFICSAAALDASLGSSEATLAESEVKRVFASNARKVILAVDHSKLGSRAPARLFNFEQITLLVTDLDPSDSRLDAFRAAVELR